jgi:hypothetical protein
VRRWVLWLLLCWPAVPGVQAADAPAGPDWVVTADGAYIVQRSAGLAWPRCVEGQRWSGRACVGRALQLDQSQAQALARTRGQVDGAAWRLPHLKELQALAAQNRQAERGHAPLLPDSPPGWCWTATANIDTAPINEYRYGNVMRGVNNQNLARLQFLHAWAVDTASGQARQDMPRRSLQSVRLVRPVD